MQNYLNDLLFKKIESGLCRLTMNGRVAIKTKNGYKSYDYKKNTLVNCSNFVFDIGDDMFFVFPTTKVVPGDIILVAAPDGRRTPRCVKSTDNGIITAFNYETSEITQLVPERHVFLGNTYFYGKIVSPFVGVGTKGKDGMNSMFKFMMMSRMFGGDKNDNNTSGNGMFGGMQNMLPFMMFSNGGGDFGNLFDNMLGDISFEFGNNAEDTDGPVTEVTEEEADKQE